LPPQGDPGANLGAVGHAPIHGDSPAADGAGLENRGRALGQERRLQRRIKGQDSLPEITAIGPRPAFAEHITFALQGQASIFLVIVGAPLHHQGADFPFFLAGQFTGHPITSRQGFSKAPGSRTRS